MATVTRTGATIAITFTAEELDVAEVHAASHGVTVEAMVRAMVEHWCATNYERSMAILERSIADVMLAGGGASAAQATIARLQRLRGVKVSADHGRIESRGVG